MPADPTARATVERYHDGTKHHFHAFARSLGYLDWASQPHPFRNFHGAPAFPLYPVPSAPQGDYHPDSMAYSELFAPRGNTRSLSAAALGDLLRHSLGLSAWKQFGSSRWSLRVNPSSGNLHPTEAYVICGPLNGLASSAGVYHYAADRHALELRCAFDADARSIEDGFLIALTSIHWRESWKYGERAFRYCQHDLGHAIAAIAIACRLVGWHAELLPDWSHASIAALTGLDRDDDFVDAEREDAGCLLWIATAADRRFASARTHALHDAVRNGRWTGRASQLSEDHVQWTFIDEVAHATRWPDEASARETVAPHAEREQTAGGRDARTIILQRRSAVAFDGRSSVPRSTFFAMLSRVMPEPRVPWSTLWWQPRVHLAIFVHRVDGLDPGLYLLPRNSEALPRLKAACEREFLWEPVDAQVPLLCLARGDARRLAERLSCDQAIAADGFFSLGMVADFNASLDTHGPAFYRNLFWETGVIGQVLYLEAEAAGARATGIGCFYDDPVHDVLGLQGHTFQSLYHFSMGVPVEDVRLTTSPGYVWEAETPRHKGDT